MENMIKYVDQNGEEKEIEIINYYTIDSRMYVVYTENKTDIDGNVEILASEYIEKSDGSIEFGNIDDNVWEQIKCKMVATIREG